MKTITTCFSIVETLLVKYMEMTETLDDDHAEIRHQLNTRSQEKEQLKHDLCLHGDEGLVFMIPDTVCTISTSTLTNASRGSRSFRVNRRQRLK